LLESFGDLMGGPSEEVELRPIMEENLRLLAGYLEKQVGLQFYDEHGRTALESALRTRMRARGVRSALEYYDHLIRHDPRRAEFQEFIDLVANNETSFFRNLPQFEALRHQVLPRLIAAREKTDTTMRIWSAGCASGEEPYSIAMILLETVPFPEKWRFDIRATDISQKSLWAAQNSSYAERALRSMPLEYQRKYMRRGPHGRYEIVPALRDMVHFQRRNLLTDPPPFDKPCDVIFCRNVIIYFRQESIRKVLKVFLGALTDDGFLLVGHAENLVSFSDDFVPVQLGDAFVYVKNQAKESGPRAPTPANSESAPSLRPAPAGVPLPDAKAETKSPKLDARSVKAETKSAKLDTKEAKAVEPTDPERVIGRAKYAFKSESYAEGESLLKPLIEEQTKNVQAYVVMACICAATGREDEALKHVQAALDFNYLSTEAHYMKGLVHQGRKELGEASLSFKRAIYSNNHFPLAHFQLARICQEQGDFRQALRCYQNADRALDSQPEGAWEEFYAGLSPVLVHRSCGMGIEFCKKRLGE
jgi:chemotaxis protein methyltransferase CheR